jgi:hypothetical protein
MHEITVNLHMHTRYSDGSGLHRDIAAAALRTGLDVVIVTDHNVLVKDFEKYYRAGSKRVLMLIGQEVHDQARDPQRNHLLIFGATRDLATFADEPQKLINAVREAGGICFLAHPYDPEAPLFRETNIDWVDWNVQGYQGIELWNHFSEFKTVIGNWPSALFHAFFPRFYSHGPVPGSLPKWDELLASGRRIAAVGGSDAHAWPYHLGLLSKNLFPYDFHFRSVNTHLLVPRPLGNDVSADSKMVLEALALGRGFIGYDQAAPTKGFHFSAQGREHNAVMGEDIPLDGSLTLQARFPAEAEVKLFRNGHPIQKWKRASNFVYTVTEPGVYRVEAYRRYLGARRGWIFSNPIYVG